MSILDPTHPLLTSPCISCENSDDEDNLNGVVAENDTLFATIDEIKNKKEEKSFLHELKRLYTSVDSDKSGRINVHQWKKSFLAPKVCLKDGDSVDAAQVFLKIDSDNDGYIDWDDIVDFFLNSNSLNEIQQYHDVAHFIHKHSGIPLGRNQMHREMVIQIDQTLAFNEYITLSSDSIRFWNPSHLRPTRVISEPGYFSSMIVFDNNHVIAVATTKRRLLFFSLETLFLLPTSISASPDAHDIKTMTQSNALKSLSIVDSDDIPLYNIPKVMHPATFSITDPTRLYFFIGDDQGYLEYFILIAPNMRQSINYSVQRLGKHQLHSDAITKIDTIPSKYCYASSSLDCSVLFWQFTEMGNHINKISCFRHSSPITSFHYNLNHNFLTTCSVSRDVFIWNTSTLKKTNRLGGHYNSVQHALGFISTSGQEYIITITNKKEFRMWDAVNFRLIRDWSDSALLRPQNNYSSSYFDERRHTLITASSCPVKWLEDSIVQVDLKEISTHQYQIIGCHYSSVFDQIVTLDPFGNFDVWNLCNGQKTFRHRKSLSSNTSDITASTLDSTGRKLLTSSFNGSTSIWNFSSGSMLCSIPPNNHRQPTSVLNSVIIDGRKLILKAGWDKIIEIYSEQDNQGLILIRTLHSHRSDITSVAAFHSGIISGDIDGEIISWSLEVISPISRTKIHHSNSIEVIECIGSCAIIGDSNGYLYLYSLPKLNIICSMNGHEIIAPYSITNIVHNTDDYHVYTSDTLGYVKKWQFNRDPVHLHPITIQRCSNTEIVIMKIVHDGNFLLTCSRDMCVRMWAVPDMEYIGLFYDGSCWNIHDFATWAKTNPFINDEKHFAQAKQLPKIKSTFLMPQKSIRDILQSNAKENVKEQKSKHNSRMNYLAIGKAIEEYIASTEQELNNEVSPTKKIDRIYNKPSFQEQLQLTTRPPDLMNKFAKLVRPQTSIESLRETKKQKTTLKIPRDKNSKKEYRIPLIQF